jgi:peptidoglycan/LPS O-acetylase OafA/YrhL
MFFPTLFLIPRFGAVGLYIFGLPIAFAVASISWHFIEMPILKARKKFSFIAKARDIEKSPARVEVSSKAVVAIEPHPAAINHDSSLG